MTLGEIKIEALKLMFTNYQHDIAVSDLSNLYQDGNYGSYLVNMPGAINRAFDRIQQKGVLRSKTITLENGTVGEYYTRYSLDNITDFYSLERVIYEGLYGKYDGNIAYRIEGSEILLPNLEEGESYRIVYKPTIAKVTGITEDTAEINLPDDVAGLIPYFIKSELYEEDETDVAIHARNVFEAGLDAIKPLPESKQNHIETVYDITRL